MANIIGLATGEYPASNKKSGDAYDNCINPECGQRDIERTWRLGGTAPNREEHQDFALYSCDPREGGCGISWARTERQLAERRAQQGLQTKWGSPSVDLGRTVSLPSRRYRENYDKIRWDK